MPIFAPDSRQNPFRARRIQRLKTLVDACIAEKGACRILDLGGTAYFWKTWQHVFDWSRTSVLALNPATASIAATEDLNVEVRPGDATKLDEFEDMSFDIVFSNSVIEHVGDWENMKAFAANARRLAPVYMVQTPNFWFPFEPHARTPFIHWLPQSLAARLLMAKRCGYWPKASTMAEARETLLSARLLGPKQYKALFPDAVIEHEWLAGMSKSMTAVRAA